MTERTRTPAQQSWFHVVNEDKSAQVDAIVTLITPAMGRAEEIASDVRALAATVDALAERVEMHDSFGDLEYRINEIEKSMKRKAIHTESWMASYDDAKSEIIGRLAALERGQGTLSQSVQSLDRDHVQMADRLRALESPGSAEAAPEPVCLCGCPKSDHNKYGCMSVVQAGLTQFNCGCPEYVPAEQAVQEPPALDPVLVAIRNLYVLIVQDSGNIYAFNNPLSYTLRYRWIYGMGASNGLIDHAEVDAAIRAYGGDAREGGK